MAPSPIKPPSSWDHDESPTKRAKTIHGLSQPRYTTIPSLRYQEREHIVGEDEDADEDEDKDGEDGEDDEELSEHEGATQEEHELHHKIRQLIKQPNDRQFHELIKKLEAESLAKAKDRWSKIIDKYSQINDDAVSDEIDIVSGRVVRDNGHLRRMKVKRSQRRSNLRDRGAGSSSELVSELVSETESEFDSEYETEPEFESGFGEGSESELDEVDLSIADSSTSSENTSLSIIQGQDETEKDAEDEYRAIRKDNETLSVNNNNNMTNNHNNSPTKRKVEKGLIPLPTKLTPLPILRHLGKDKEKIQLTKRIVFPILRHPDNVEVDNTSDRSDLPEQDSIDELFNN